MAVSQFDNVFVFDAADEEVTGNLVVTAMYLFSTGNCTAVFSDGTNEVIKMRANFEGSSLAFPGGHKFPSGLKLTSITGAVSGVVYVFVK